jgi:Ca-activated chloride channel family protein
LGGAAIALAALAACHSTRAPRTIASTVAAPAPLAAPTRLPVTMEAVGAAALVADRGDPHYAVRVRVSAPPLRADQRPPLSLALVLDTSGSMEGAAIAAARDAARALVARMGDHDRVAIIAFHSQSEVLVPMLALDAGGRRRALAAIDGIRATGTTDLGGGLAAGLDELARTRTGAGLERVVLVSDGVPNTGDALGGLVLRATREHVAISALGLGLEFDEALLGRIAQDTGGEYLYAPDADAVARVFDDELTRMQTAVAANLTLTVRPGPGVVLGDAPWLTAVGGDRQAFLGDLAAGETRDVFVPVAVPAHADGATIEVLDADLSLVDVATGQAERRHDFVGVKASRDDHAIAAAVVIDLAAGKARADAAGVILQAIGLARQGLIDRAEQLLIGGAEAASAEAAARGDDELAVLARRMIEIRKSLVFLRAAQLAAPPPVAPPPGTAPYPLARRPTAAAPAAVESVLKEAYDESEAVVRGSSRN